MRGAANPASSRIFHMSCRASSNSSASRNGAPPTGSKGLGTRAVDSPRRVPSPPTRMTAWLSIHPDWRQSRHGRRRQIARSRRGAHRRTYQVSHPPSLNLTGAARPPAAFSASMSCKRSSGSTMNIMKPPPPAPETLPASAPLARAMSRSSSMRAFEMRDEVCLFAVHESCRSSAIALHIAAQKPGFHFDSVRFQPVEGRDRRRAVVDRSGSVLADDFGRVRD